MVAGALPGRFKTLSWGQKGGCVQGHDSQRIPEEDWIAHATYSTTNIGQPSIYQDSELLHSSRQSRKVRERIRINELNVENIWDDDLDINAQRVRSSGGVKKY